MQVTDAMVAAAMKAYRLQPADLNTPDPDGMYVDHRRIRDAIQAALDAAENVDLPVTATVRVQIDEAAFHASVTDAVNRLHAGLPRDENGRITIASLQGDANPCRPVPPMTIPDELLSTDGYEDHAAALVADMERRAAQQWIPITEPRPGSTIDDIAAVIGQHRQAVLEWIADRDLGRPGFRFPEPVVSTGDVERDLYDLDAVKAWYDALPQAADG